MVTLKEFTNSDFDTFISWCTCEETICHCELNFKEKDTLKLSKNLISSEKLREKRIVVKIISQLTALVVKNPKNTSTLLSIFNWNITTITML